MKHKAIGKHKPKNQIANRVIYIAAIIEPLFVLPQVVQIFRLRDASSVSLLTWIGFNILTAIWIWWAIVNKERIILLYQGMYFVFNTLVIIGALLFGAKWI